jgi:iron(III) transport system substrate-binding protein
MQPRREFLRIALVGSIASLLAACAPAPAASPTAPPAPAPKPTDPPKPAATSAPPAAAPTTAPAVKPTEAAKPAGAADPLAALLEKAKPEKEVQFWGSNPSDEMAPLAEAFGKRFPGMELKFFEIRNEEVVQRAIAEARQGKASFDMGDSQISGVAALIERDLLQGYDDWTTVFKDLNPQAPVLGGRLLVVDNMAFPIAYNTSMLKAADAPKTWEDLLDPKWKGKLLVESRGGAFAYLGVDWGQQKVTEYVDKIKAQEPVYARGGTAVLEQGIAGAAPVIVGTYVHLVLQAARKGAPVDWVRTASPLGVTSSSAYIIKNSPHPNAAKLFAGWYASDEGRKVHLESGFKTPLFGGSPHPAAKDVAENKIKLVAETPDNYKQIDDLKASIAKQLGG